MLYDSLGRIHNYLRISVIDNCNFRCTYCMPDAHYTFMPKKQWMTASEIESFASIFVALGVTKIRITGGEPLLRTDFSDIIQRLAKLNIELLLTSNGSLIHKHIHAIQAAGIRSVNVSLDSLHAENFKHITQKNQFQQVWSNILLLLDQGIRVKINAVAMRGHIEHEILDFIECTRKLPLHIRFIEFMPFTGNHWDKNKVIRSQELLELVQSNYDIIKLQDEPHATARKYKAIGHEGTFAFISTMSDQFCGDCNRIRLTAEGKIKNCLFGKDEIDLLQALRSGEDIVCLIQKSILSKHAALGGQFESGYENTSASTIINRSMIRIGG